YRDKAGVRVPVRYACLDPQQRIRAIRVDVWSGQPAADRPFSLKNPDPQPSDGPRQSQPLKYSDDSATGEILLPKLADGEVAWIQPQISFKGGGNQWGAPQSVDSSVALDRVSAELFVKLTEHKERTVHLKSSQSIALVLRNGRYAASTSVELDLLESVGPDPKGAQVATSFGLPTASQRENNESFVAPLEVAR